VATLVGRKPVGDHRPHVADVTHAPAPREARLLDDRVAFATADADDERLGKPRLAFATR
jgi:hypothetical protein